MNPILRNILIGAGAVVAVVFIFRRSDAQKTADAALGFTEDTGVIGTLGAATNRASGGLLADAGSAIGLFFSNIFDTDTKLPADFVGPPI